MEVSSPLVSPGMKELDSDVGRAFGIDTRNVGSFETIAVKTTKRKVFCDC